jgi:Holliday junction resolvasome RuvABC endonuclease subunit
MSEFTPEQHALLKTLDRKYLSYIHSLHEVIEEYGYRVAAIERVLYEKGIATPQEVQTAEEEIRAALMVEKAINPKIRAADETLHTLLEGM